MSERTLLLGFDLGEEKSQMAVYDREKNIPVLIGQTEENPEGLIPTDRKSTRLNSSHSQQSRMPSSA